MPVNTAIPATMPKRIVEFSSSADTDALNKHAEIKGRLNFLKLSRLVSVQRFLRRTFLNAGVLKETSIFTIMRKIIFNTGKYSARVDFIILLLRIVGGSFMITHGWGKALKVLAGPPYEFGDPIGIGVPASLILAAFAEFVCAIFVIFGFATRLSAIPVMATMAVAAFVAHADDAFFAKELPLVYLTLFFSIAILGAGRYSLDYLLQKKR